MHRLNYVCSSSEIYNERALNHSTQRDKVTSVHVILQDFHPNAFIFACTEYQKAFLT